MSKDDMILSLIDILHGEGWCPDEAMKEAGFSEKETKRYSTMYWDNVIVLGEED